jgi:uncharacterized RDD family membrane protein YckC
VLLLFERKSQVSLIPILTVVEKLNGSATETRFPFVKHDRCGFGVRVGDELSSFCCGVMVDGVCITRANDSSLIRIAFSFQYHLQSSFFLRCLKQKQNRNRLDYSMMHPIAGVVNHFIEVADVDGVVRRIDVNNIVERIDVDTMVQRIDMNKVLSKINWDDQLQRIDFDAILRRVDTSSIVARSSTGVFTTILDTLRTQVIMIDLYLRIVVRCQMWRQQDRQSMYLPPAPGPNRQRHDRELYPRGRSNKVVAVQGRYSGFVSKALAIGIDIFTVTLLFAMLFGMIRWSLVLFLGDTQQEAKNKTTDFQNESSMELLVIYCFHWFLYFFLSTALMSRTLGMALVGLKVSDGNHRNPYASISVQKAFIRTCCLPLTLTLCPPLAVIGLVRRDGRMIHDIVTNTGIVYLWDAKEARIRHRALREEQGSVISDDDESDDLDHVLAQDEDNFYNDQEDHQGQEVLLRQDDGDTSSTHASQISSSYYSTFPSERQSASHHRGGCCNIV